MTDQVSLPPPVMWAQRSNHVFLTINLEDAKNPEIKINKDSIYFKGVGGVDQKLYEVEIPLYKEIDIENSKSFNRGRCIEFLLTKINQEESYWPRLTSTTNKHHWLKCDFNKWHDEDDSGDEGVGGMGGGVGGPPGMGGMGGGGDFEEMMRQMGGLGGGIGGAKPSFDDLDEGGDEADADSDDEPIPDLE